MGNKTLQILVNKSIFSLVMHCTGCIKASEKKNIPEIFNVKHLKISQFINYLVCNIYSKFRCSYVVPIIIKRYAC